MLTKNNSVFGSILTMYALLFACSSSQATLIGDEVTCFVNPATIWTCDKTVAIVGEGIEFGLVLDGIRFFDVDISGEHVRINYVAEGGLGAGAGENAVFGDLQWAISPSGQFVATEDLGIANFSTAGTAGIEIGDVSFSDGAIIFNFDDTNWRAGSDTFVEWDLVVKRAKYIDSTALSGLNGNSYDAVAALRTTKTDQLQVLIKDSGTNVAINSVPFFWSDWTPIAVASIDANGDNVDDIAVLAVHKRTGQIKVQVRDALTDARIIETAYLTADWSPRGLMAVDGNGDGIKDLGVLAVHKTTNSVMTVIKDVATIRRLTTVPFQSGF